MPNPRSDPRLIDPPLQDDLQRDRIGELQRDRIGEPNKSNAMWGWIAGGVVLALLLVFVFGRSPTTETASTQMNAPPPGQSTLSPPTAPPTPPAAQAPRTAPATTGQGTAQ